MALPPRNPDSRTSTAITILMSVLAMYLGALATFSLLNGKLYSPLTTVISSPPELSYFLGVSIYITIATTLLTTALIRIALRISK